MGPSSVLKFPLFSKQQPLPPGLAISFWSLVPERLEGAGAHVGRQGRPSGTKLTRTGHGGRHVGCVKLASDHRTLTFNLRDFGNCKMSISHQRRVPKN